MSCLRQKPEAAFGVLVGYEKRVSSARYHGVGSMSFGPVIDQLIDSLRVLPGVGQKSAQRMAMHLLERDRRGAGKLAAALKTAVEQVGHCRQCRNLSELDECRICRDQNRDAKVLCIIESPSDLIAIEQSQHYKGKYFVLAGSMSPIDGRGPEEIGIPQLLERVRESGVAELILATNPTIEGEATAQYIAERVKADGVLVTRLAHGIPLGGELGYVDGGTLSHAFAGRKPLPDA